MSKIIRLTESELRKVVNRIVQEQKSKDVGCLVNSGFKRKTIGGPMNRVEVYTTTKNGLTYQYSMLGGVRVFGNGTHKVGDWVCESGKIKIVNLKDTPMMPM